MEGVGRRPFWSRRSCVLTDFAGREACPHFIAQAVSLFCSAGFGFGRRSFAWELSWQAASQGSCDGPGPAASRGGPLRGTFVARDCCRLPRLQSALSVWFVETGIGVGRRCFCEISRVGGGCTGLWRGGVAASGAGGRRCALSGWSKRSRQEVVPGSWAASRIVPRCAPGSRGWALAFCEECGWGCEHRAPLARVGGLDSDWLRKPRLAPSSWRISPAFRSTTSLYGPGGRWAGGWLGGRDQSGQSVARIDAILTWLRRRLTACPSTAGD